MQAGFEVGFGTPYGWLLPEDKLKEIKQETEQGNKKADIKLKISPNWRFGAVWGYGFPISNTALAIGPDMGLFIGTKHKCAFVVSDKKIELNEQHLYIPLAIKLATVEKETGVQKGGLALGYEWRILLSSKCNLFGNIDQSQKKELEKLAKSTKLGGSIFLSGKVDLFKGVYCMAHFKLPITDLLAIKREVKRQNTSDSKAKWHTIRVLNSSFVELSLGVNIMKWL